MLRGLAAGLALCAAGSVAREQVMLGDIRTDAAIFLLLLLIRVVCGVVADGSAPRGGKREGEGQYATLTIYPKQLSLTTDSQTWVEMTCTASRRLLANHTVCSMTLSKVPDQEGRTVSPTPINHGKRQSLVQMVVGKLPHLLTHLFKMTVHGSRPFGTLQVNLSDVTCVVAGYYVCDVLYVQGRPLEGEEEDSFCQGRKESRSASGALLSTEVFDRVFVTVPVEQVILKANFSQSSMNTVDMTLTCTVHTTVKIKEWRWETYDDKGHWQPVSQRAHTITDDVIQGQTPACLKFYSKLCRELRPSDVGKQYRCLVVTGAGLSPPKVSAYYNVTPIAFRDQLLSNNSETSTKVRSAIEAGDGPSVNSQSKGTTYLVAIPASIGVLALAVGGVTTYLLVSARNRNKKKQVQFIDPPPHVGRALDDDVDGGGGMRSPIASDDELSLASSSSGKSSSAPSSAASYPLPNDPGTGLKYLFGPMTAGETNTHGLSSLSISSPEDDDASDTGTGGTGSATASDISMGGSETNSEAASRR